MLTMPSVYTSKSGFHLGLPNPVHYHGSSLLLLKAILTATMFIGIVWSASQLRPFLTFFLLDILLSVYLFSLFRGWLRSLFLIHPFVVYLLGLGFQVPFTEIGTGWTYLATFDQLIGEHSLAVDEAVWQDKIFRTDIGHFGFSGVYVGVLPVLLFPKFLFVDAPDITVYYSLALWTLLCTAIAVNVAIVCRVFRSNVLLIIALYITISPTFFEINSVLHRYTLLVLGLFLFLTAYLGLTRSKIGIRTLPLVILMGISIFLVGISKAPLFLSLGLFVILDLWVRDKLPIVSATWVRLEKSSRFIVLVVLLLLVQVLSREIVPEVYVMVMSQRGGQYQTVANLPLIGLVLRVVYATLSPFPWINFSQTLHLYGGNNWLLWMHILSALLAVWIILSILFRGRWILQGADDIRTSVVFGVAIMASLAYAAVGYHVYLAPALPFLSSLFHERVNRISLLYPIGFCVIMELIAQLARFIR